MISRMGSKWGDAVALALAFDVAAGDEAEGQAFQAQCVHHFSLMHALALQYLRRDNELTNLCDDAGRARAYSDVEETSPLLLPPPAGCFSNQDDPDVHAARLAAVPLPVLGGVALPTCRALERYDDRVGYVFSAMLALLGRRRKAGGVPSEPPVFSRVHHCMSDGMLGFQQARPRAISRHLAPSPANLARALAARGARQARKIEDTPFPFPYAQLLSFMLYAFVCLFPLLAASKTGSQERRPTPVAPPRSSPGLPATQGQHRASPRPRPAHANTAPRARLLAAAARRRTPRWWWARRSPS